MSGLTTLSEDGPSPALIDVILVAGIGGDQESTWDSLVPDSPGFLDFFRSHVPNTRVSTYSYPLFENDGSIFSHGGLNRAADRLLAAIGGLKRTRRQRIVLAGHDIGGILIKQVGVPDPKIERDSLHRYSFKPLSAISLFETYSIPPMSRMSVNRLLGSNAELSSHPRTLYAVYLATAVRDINAQFEDIRAQLCVLEHNLVSAHEDLQKRVFELTETEVQSMVLARGYSLEETLPHSELPRQMSASARMLMMRHLTDIRLEVLPGLRSSATSHSSLRRYRWDQTTILRELPVFQKEIFQNWVSYQDKPFLAFRRIEDVYFTYSAVFSQMVRASESSALFHRFDFRRSSSQMKTVGDFLCTILKETLVESSSATHYGGELGWNLKDLFKLYREAALVGQSGQEVWFLLNFDESIDSSTWLLNTLYSLAASSDVHFRVIFINSSDSTLNLDSTYTTMIDRARPEHPPPEEYPLTETKTSLETPVTTNEPAQRSVSEPIEEPVQEAQGVQSGTIEHDTQSVLRSAESQTLDVIRKNPRVAFMGLELFNLMQRSDVAYKNKELVTDWLVNLPQCVIPTTVQKQISNISGSSIESTFKMILSLDKPVVNNSRLTTGIFELAALALRPLTYLELADLDEARKDWETGYIPEVMRPTSIFSLHPGIFDLIGNEVHFRHPELHRYLLSEPSPLHSLELRSLSKRHSLYARLCLEYLTSSHGLNRLDAAVVSADDVGAPQSRTNFLSYAAQFWLRHASLASSEWSPEGSIAQRFLSNTHVLDSWARVYWHCTSSATRQSLERSGPVAILVEFAPESTFDTILKTHKDTDWMKGQYLNALLAAARVGKSRTVGLLLQDQSLSPEMFDFALQAALQSEDEATISIITSEIPDNGPLLVGIPTALLKALELGQEHVPRRLLPFISWEAIDDDDKKHILAAAIVGNNVELTNDLLERFHLSQAHNIFEAVSQAVRYGSTELSSVLMDRLLKVEQEEENYAIPSDDLPTMELAAFDHGRHFKRSDILDTEEGQVPVENQDVDITTDEPEDTVDIDPEPSSEQSGSISPTYSHYAQVVLNHAITFGQHTILRALVTTLQNHHSSPIDISSLLQAAIQQRRPRCLSALLNSYENMSPRVELDKRELLDLAVSGGNVAIVQEILERLTVLNGENFPEIFRTAMERSPPIPSIVQALIEFGRKCVPEDILKPQLDYMEPAIDNKSIEIVSLLIAEKAQLDSRLILGGRTPLYEAAYQGCVEIVEALIKAGADVNMSNDSGWSPVHAAYDNAAILKLLLDNGADVNAKTSDGDTALYLATKWGFEDCVVEILKHKPQLNLVIDNTTVLSKAVDSGCIKIAELLLDAGEDPCHPETQAANALLLHLCVFYTFTDLLKRLLLYKFDLEHTEERGRTALNCLSSANDIPALRLLLRRGANLETQDKPWNDTPLSNAVRFGDAALTSFLISEGANTNAIVGRKGFESTPLLVACQLGSSPDVLTLLVDNGANTRFVTRDAAGTIFQAACRSSSNSRSETLSYLVDNDLVDVELKSDWWGSNLATACWLTDANVIDILIQRGADVNAIDRAGRTPFHFALYQTIEHVKVLCNRKDGNNADLDALDHMERNALHFAVISGRLDLVQYIIKRYKGLAKKKDCDGWTPLSWAVRIAGRWGVETSQRAAIIEALLNDGASVMDVGEDPLEWAPYDVARYYGLENDVIKLVTPTEEQIEQSSQGDAWVKRLAARPRTARAHDTGFCHICLLGLWGVYFNCTECQGFVMCFKCYRSKNRNLVHDPHPFTPEHQDDEYESNGDEGTASGTSERRYQLSTIVSEVGHDSDGEVDEDVDNLEETDDDESLSSSDDSFI